MKYVYIHLCHRNRRRDRFFLFAVQDSHHRSWNNSGNTIEESKDEEKRC